EQIPQQAQQIFNRINELQKIMSDSYSVGLLLSFIDNYLILKDQQYQFAVLTNNQLSFQNLQINIMENTEIFKVMQLLVVWDRLKRVSISEIKE
ncbi:hypothetical protein ABPG72_001068, partial [Tetrahymena utriculariae]